MENTQENEIETYKFPAIWENRIKRALTKAQKAARRLGLPEPELMHHEYYMNVRNINTAFWKVKIAPPLRLGDYKTLAVIDHTGAENIVFWFGDEDDPTQEKWHKASASCDHCGQNRHRKRTYVVRSKEGEFLQVGSSCVKDFTGHRSFTSNFITAMASLYKALEGFDELPPGWTSTGGLSVTEPLFFILAILEDEDPFVPSRLPGSTKEKALMSQTPKNFRRWDEMLEEEDNFLVKKASSILEWAQNIEADYGYLANLRAVANKPFWASSDWGLAASLPQAFYKEKEEKRKKEKVTENSEHFGEVGERYKNLEMTIAFVTGYESYYGSGQVIKLEDDNGNQFVWFTSSFPELGDRGYGVQEYTGYRVKVKGTVKEHSDYEGTPQTVLTRCSLELIEEES